MLISFFYLEILTAEFGNYSDLFGMLRLCLSCLRSYCMAARTGVTYSWKCVTPHVQHAAGELDLQRLDAMEEHQA